MMGWYANKLEYNRAYSRSKREDPAYRARKRRNHATRRRKVKADPVAQEARRVWARKYLYGVDEEQFAAMYARQNGACGICAKPFEGTVPCVDHCHTSLVVRGLLCRACNLGLGMVDKVGLASITRYLSGTLK